MSHRQYTDLSGLTKEEKTEHRRQQFRQSQARSRAAANKPTKQQHLVPREKRVGNKTKDLSAEDQRRLNRESVQKHRLVKQIKSKMTDNNPTPQQFEATFHQQLIAKMQAGEALTEAEIKLMTTLSIAAQEREKTAQEREKTVQKKLDAIREVNSNAQTANREGFVATKEGFVSTKTITKESLAAVDKVTSAPSKRIGVRAQNKVVGQPSVGKSNQKRGTRQKKTANKKKPAGSKAGKENKVSGLQVCKTLKYAPSSSNNTCLS